MDRGNVDRTPGDFASIGVPNPLQRNAPKGGGIAPGVVVKNGRKAYGNRPPILYDFNMNVPRGTIYGLLGSSGCGKTTILSCIVGLRNLDQGEILVCGAKPGTRESGIPGPRIGYMPQDLALYSNMTIKEIHQYYGRIYGMEGEDIEKRLGYLMGFLDLPESSRVIGTLSGGQQRRTSLAVALVHQPELLILDEPTVGVDPLVREKIWEHLVNMVKTKKTTIIVTTHYIEEARQAHTVGLMRNGKLLTEKNPKALLIEHNCELLEDIVLKLCKKDNLNLVDGDPTNEVTQTLQQISFYSGNKDLTVGGKAPDIPITLEKSPIVGLKFQRRYTEENMTNRRKSLRRQDTVGDLIKEIGEDYFYSRKDRIKALIIRNYITFFRNIIFMVGILCIPGLQVIIINFVIGYDPKNMNFAMINHELPNDLNDSVICPYDHENGGYDNGLSCRYISKFPEDQIIMKRLKSEEEGLEQIKQGEIWGYMSIPANFSKHLLQFGVEQKFAENTTIDGSTITFKMDQSHYLGASLLIKVFYESYQKFVGDLAMDLNQTSSVAQLPIQLRRPIYGAEESGFREFIAPAALIIIQFFVPLAAGGIAYIGDKKHGTLDRSMVAGVTTFDVLFSFMVTEGSIIIFQALISFVILVFGFGTVIEGSFILFMAMLLMSGVAGLSMGFLIAMLVDEEMEAVIITLGLYTPILILSGIIWPLEGVHPIVSFISYSLPCTYATESVRSIVSRGWGFSHSRVWPGFAMLFGWSLFCMICIALVHKLKNK